MTLFKSSPIFILCLIVQLTAAQEIEFGDISKESLQETEYALDTDASAAILYSYRNTYFQSHSGFHRLITEVHTRIKIYSKDGFEHATESIPLFQSKGEREEVRRIKAFTYTLENGQIVKSKLEKDQIFEEEMSYNYDQITFTMPNVKEGSIVEYTYEITSPFIWNIDEFRLQADIPIKNLVAEIRTPKGFRFKRTQKGFVPFYPKQETKRDNRINMDVIVDTYSLKNVPALKAESHVDNIDNYRAGVLFELVSIELPGYFKSFAQTWGDVAKSIGNSDDYKNQLDKTKSFDESLDQLLVGKVAPMEKAQIVFGHVKETVAWNGRDGIYFQNGLRKTLKEKKGNSADVNLLLVGMLRYAGLKANPVVLSTKENLIPLFPTLDRLNHVIAHMEIDGKAYFLDATDKYSDINILPIRDYNWQGVLVDNGDMKWKLVNIASPKQAVNLNSIKASLADDGSLEGTYQSRSQHHSAYVARKEMTKKDHDGYIAELEGKLDNIEISNFEVENPEASPKPLSASFDFYQEEGADVLGDKMYLQPLSFLSMEENPFKSDTREYPIDFGFPFKESSLVELTLPEGYRVESLPESLAMRLPDNSGKFIYNIANKGDTIQLSVIFEIDKAMISPLNYPLIREYFKQVITKEAEQVVLVKMNNGSTEGTVGGR